MNSSLQQNPSYDNLYNKNPEFKKLCDEHLSLKREAAKLGKSRFLSESETDKLHLIKKKKLVVKDQIQAMLDKHSS